MCSNIAEKHEIIFWDSQMIGWNFHPHWMSMNETNIFTANAIHILLLEMVWNTENLLFPTKPLNRRGFCEKLLAGT